MRRSRRARATRARYVLGGFAGTRAALLFVVGGFAGTMAGSPVSAQQPRDTTPRRLAPVTVTRDRERSPNELPFAISSTRPDSVSPGQTHTLPEQTFAFIPGVTVANRTNPSQDARISIRGFGARSQFGVRSVRVMRDGMPLTLADGQTPLDYLDLEAVGRVEAIRGTASALYGNASGGVLDLRSGPPPAAPYAGQVRSWFGDNNLKRNALFIGGVTQRAWYSANIGHTTGDGARAYSKQGLTNAFLRAGTTLLGTDLTLLGLGIDMPTAENPGALTRIQFDTNPGMADPTSVLRKARKAVHQVQLGLQAQRQVKGADVQAQVYGGTRSLYNPLIPNVVEVGRHSSGTSMRVGATLPWRQRVTAGVDAQWLSDNRKNWAPCNGVTTITANCPVLGVERGVATLDQRERVTSIGAYVRDEFEFGRIRASLGVRSDNTNYDLTDQFTTDGRDDSGTRTMQAVSPMGGVSLRLGADQSAYVTYSTAFETPTTTEMVNKPDSSAGLNPLLDPQYSSTIEVGTRGVAGQLQYDIALFSTRVRDELIPFDIGGGRNAYQNAGKTRRRGAEVALGTSYGPVAFTAAYTYSFFRFVKFQSGTRIVDGQPIPGVPEHQIQTNIAWHGRRGFAVAEWMAKSQVVVSDANLFFSQAPAFALTNLRGGVRTRWVTPVVGVHNVFDRKYVSSVAINAAGTAKTGKFYEPGPGRTWFVGLTAATASW